MIRFAMILKVQKMHNHKLAGISIKPTLPCLQIVRKLINTPLGESYHVEFCL